ncbi:MAG: lasso peptide biosynthesis B2 protein [Planctomycetota bacterium]|nr:lasso peptide biosynthesis B2 protein [Planctomycetota bacterium]
MRTAHLEPKHESRARRPSARLRLEAVAWVGVFRLMLWVLPFRSSLALARRAAGRAPDEGSHVTPAEVEGALAGVGRFVPSASCLPRALAAGVLLSRREAAVDLLLGTPVGQARAKFAAHAWVEVDGVPSYGATETSHHPVARLPLRPSADA